MSIEVTLKFIESALTAIHLDIDAYTTEREDIYRNRRNDQDFDKLVDALEQKHLPHFTQLANDIRTIMNAGEAANIDVEDLRPFVVSLERHDWDKVKAHEPAMSLAVDRNRSKLASSLDDAPANDAPVSVDWVAIDAQMPKLDEIEDWSAQNKNTLKVFGRGLQELRDLRKPKFGGRCSPDNLLGFDGENQFWRRKTSTAKTLFYLTEKINKPN